MIPEWQRKFEELKRCLSRIKKLYDGLVISEVGEDSFQSPKDLILNFFRVNYELKETLKKSHDVPKSFHGYKGDIEIFCNNDHWVALGLDIANQTKHVTLTQNRANKKIGKINSHIHLLSGDGHDHTEVSIEVGNQKEDCLQIADRVFNSWQQFLKKSKLISA